MVWPPGIPNTNLTPSALSTSTTARPALIFVIKSNPSWQRASAPVQCTVGSTRSRLRLLRCDQRTSASGKRTECLLARDRGDHIVNVPLALRLLGFLDLQQVKIAQ